MVMGNSENSCVFNFAILLKSRKSRKLYARQILVFYSILPNPNALVAVSNGMQAVKLLQQNPPVVKQGCWLTQVVLYNVSKMVVVLVEVKNYYYIRLTAFFPGQPG